MPKNCQSCGMPLLEKQDFALEDESSEFCRFCVDEKGNVRSCEEVFEGGVDYFMSQLGEDRELAERLTRLNMSRQLYWQGKDEEVLKGELATAQEFASAMDKLS